VNRLASIVLYVTAPCSPALSMVVHIGSAHVIALIDFARNTEMLVIAQDLNAAKPKLMMRGGRHVFLGDFMKIIMTKTHPFLSPTKK
jgi:hypothetical protein